MPVPPDDDDMSLYIKIDITRFHSCVKIAEHLKQNVTKITIAWSCEYYILLLFLAYRSSGHE